MKKPLLIIPTAVAGLVLLIAAAGGAFADDSETASPAAFVASADGGTRTTSSPTPKPTDIVTEIVEVVSIPFDAIEVDDPNIDAGQIVVTTAGVAGEQTNTYRITMRAGAEVARELVAQVATIAPVTQVTSRGTRQPPPPPPPAPVTEPAGGGAGCDPNYEGQCVPIDSDVDCAGGSGNGPSYTPGPVLVVGVDVYDLDRDGDGIACD